MQNVFTGRKTDYLSTKSGKISSLELTDAADSTKSAKVTFEKSTAAKTAELLNDTQLGTNSVKVTADTSSSTSTTGNTVHDSHDDEISQEDKPRTRIIAEYLAHGYTISDNVINKAIAVDNTHGYTDRFTTLVKNADAKTGATATLQNVDAKLGVTEKGREAWSRINSFFSSALETNAGHKILDFYSQGKKEVLDVHTEARRLADMKNPNNNQSSGNADPSLAQDKNLHNVPGTDGKRTAC